MPIEAFVYTELARRELNDVAHALDRLLRLIILPPEMTHAALEVCADLRREADRTVMVRPTDRATGICVKMADGRR